MDGPSSRLVFCAFPQHAGFFPFLQAAKWRQLPAPANAFRLDLIRQKKITAHLPARVPVPQQLSSTHLERLCLSCSSCSVHGPHSVAYDSACSSISLPHTEQHFFGSEAKN